MNDEQSNLILLVEDEESHAELIERAFEIQPGANIRVVRNLASARAALADTPEGFDLVITDLRLPDGLGTQLLGGDGSDPSIALVVMTSQGDEVAAVEAMKAGALDYIVKSNTSLFEMPRTAMRAIRQSRLVKERQRLEAALVERERLAAVGTAAAMLAHEIGNPLNSMKLNAELLMRRLRKLNADTDGLERTLATCMDEIDRLHELVEDFRELSRQDRLSLSSVAIGRLVGQIIESQAAYAAASSVEIAAELPDESVRAVLDSNKITQVLVNLIKNSIEAMPDGGRLKVSVKPSGQNLVIQVQDTGMGVPDGVNIFEPFKSTKCHGSGLGLAIVRQIVLAHGGSVDHRGVPGGGTRFETILPLDSTSAQAPASTFVVR